MEESLFPRIDESSRPSVIVNGDTLSESTVTEPPSASSKGTEMRHIDVIETSLKKEEFTELDEWLSSAFVEMD